MGIHASERVVCLLIRTATDSARDDEVLIYAGTGAASGGALPNGQVMASGQVAVRYRSDWASPGEAVEVTKDGGTTWAQAGAGLTVEVMNNSGGDFAAGDVVYIASYDSTNGLPEVLLADADAVGKPAQYVLLEAITDGASGQIAAVATVSGLDTSSWAEDTVLYLSGTATTGNTLVSTAPTAATSQQQIVGVVEVQDASDGQVRFDMLTGAGAVIERPERLVLARGSMIRGSSAGKGEPLDLSTADAVPIGDGTDLTTMVLPTTGIVAKTAAGAASGRTISNATNGGLSVSDGDGVAGDPTLAMDINDLAAAAVDVAADSVAIYDSDGAVTAQEAIADIVTAMAGTSLTATAGVLAVDAATDSAAGAVELATTAEVDTGTDATRAITPDALNGSAPAISVANVTDTKAGIDSDSATHIASDGSDHAFIDQDVTSGSSPTLDGANFTGIPLGAYDANSIALADMAQMAADGLVGNDSGGAADPQHLTVAEANTLLNVATATAPGTVEIATTAEVDTGTDDVRAISPLALNGSSPSLAGPTITGAMSLNDGSLVQRKGTGTGTGDVIERIGLTATEGMELVVYEDTVSPAAVETNLINVPANALIVSVQANCEAALTGGGTTVTWSIGTAADPDKYGTAGDGAGDTLAQNGKLNFMPAWTFLTASEQMVLTGCATGGAADGDTALTVGSVRVRVIYYALNSLDNA